MLLSNRWQGLLMICLALTLTLVVALPAQAQRDTGIMSVRALDPDGVPLPGVMVVAKGPVGTQTQYTGIDGTARFPGLYPGAGYSATFTLDGFKTVIRDGLSIQAQRTTAFELEMELATVEETITVTGARRTGEHRRRWRRQRPADLATGVGIGDPQQQLQRQRW